MTDGPAGVQVTALFCWQQEKITVTDEAENRRVKSLADVLRSFSFYLFPLISIPF